MTELAALHPAVQKHIESVVEAGVGGAYCGCTIDMSEIYGRDVQMCRFHTGMSIGAEEALEWEEAEEEK